MAAASSSSSKPSSFRRLNLFFIRLLLKHLPNPKCAHHNNTSLAHIPNPSHKTLIFDVESALLKSSSLFPYFMLVAFEAGGLLRALLLFLLYPFIALLISEDMRLQMMVMICFFGIKEESFRTGRAVLPKFFLEDVGMEVFEVMRKCGKKVGVSNLPQVMIESFLKDYLDIEFVCGRELKVVCGYYVGVMTNNNNSLEEIGLNNQEDDGDESRIIGISSFNNNSLDHPLFSHCKEIYLVSEEERRRWSRLPNDKYPKLLIFHDGRLAFRPTFEATLAMFMWVPFGSFLAIFSAFVGLLFPYNLLIPILSFTGMKLRLIIPYSISSQPTQNPNQKGLLYVCNHRTLLDPLFISYSLKKPMAAVSYSLSRMSEVLAPIRTVRLTRDRDEDGRRMEKLLRQGDLVVCPEGTTCREDYLLRFSPLFTEMSEEIVPVALDTQVSMFHGTTASGFKCLDAFVFLMNPSPVYIVQHLPKVAGTASAAAGGRSKFEVANEVQMEIGKALGFKCTNFTRKHKYLVLAGNDGSVVSQSRHNPTN